jgi:hypothetical protein
MQKTSKKTLELLNEVYGKNTFVKIRYFDDAIIGFEVETRRLIYSVKKCVNILKTKMSTEEAIDYFYMELYSENVNENKVIFCEDYLIKKPNF